MRQVRKPPSGRARNRRIEPHELPVLDAALRQCRNPLVRDVFLFALATGMRRGEVLSLVWPNVNLANRTAYLPLTKNGETRFTVIGCYRSPSGVSARLCHSIPTCLHGSRG